MSEQDIKELEKYREAKSMECSRRHEQCWGCAFGTVCRYEESSEGKVKTSNALQGEG